MCVCNYGHSYVHTRDGKGREKNGSSWRLEALARTLLTSEWLVLCVCAGRNEAKNKVRTGDRGHCPSLWRQEALSSFLPYLVKVGLSLLT